MIDSTKEDIAIAEAQKLEIPIVAIVDTNGDPENIDYPIPGNDDAVRAIELFTSKLTDAIKNGKKNRIEKELLEAKAEEEIAGDAEEAMAAEASPSSEEKPTAAKEKPKEALEEKQKEIKEKPEAAPEETAPKEQIEPSSEKAEKTEKEE